MAAPSEEGQQTGLNKNKKYYIHIKGDKAVILYPSLVTPSLVESGDYGAAGGCLTVILATDEGFYTGIHCKDPGRKDAAIGSLTARKLHSQLALAPWGEKAIFDTGALEYSNQKWQLISPLHMIYLSHTGAVEAYGNKYRGWYLGELKGEKRPVQGYDADGKPRPWGVIHEGAAKMYASKGYKYLFQLNFKGLNRAPGMYELAFVYYELPDDNELSKIAEVADDLQKVVKDENDNEISRKSFDEEEKDKSGGITLCCYTDPDDDV
ncbi:MAG: hypothetical protein LBH14_02005, partial [Desulfobulbaceae bacterium]|nr:hypothetical protein [Desulfobulbaceae bacterium]